MEAGSNREADGESVEERRADVAAFISGELSIAARVLWERKRAGEAIAEFEARPYQQEAWERLWKAREDGSTEALLHLATGLGKTSIAVLDYAKFRSELRQNNLDASPRALFVVHQNNILEQASERFQAFMPNMTQSYFSRKNPKPQSELTLATFQTLVRSSHVLPPDYFDYIIYDEAHHIEADTYKQVVEYFQPKFQLGMTATPERMDSRDITQHFGKPLYSKSLPEAIRENLLAGVDYRIVFDDAVEEAINNGFEPHSIAEIKSLFDTKLRNHEIANQIRSVQAEIRKKDESSAVKTVIFCENIEHADIIAEFVSGESYHSSLPKKTRDETLSLFREGSLQIVTVRDMFNEGVDIPDARLLVMVRSTASKTIFEQQLGRGLRKIKGKQEVTVLDFVGNVERLAMINELLQDIFQVDNPTEEMDGDDEEKELKLHDSSFKFNQRTVDLLSMYERMRHDNAGRWREVTNDDLIKLALGLSPDQPLTTPMIAKLPNDIFPNSHIITDRFGSMKNFYLACGFSIPVWERYSSEEIIELARELSPHEALTVTTIIELGIQNFPSMPFVYQRFGSIRELQRLMGYAPARQSWAEYSNDDIVSLALEISPDKPIDQRMIRTLEAGSFPSSPLIQKRFGSFVSFYRACGFEPSIDWGVFSNQELADLARQLSPNTPLTQHAIINLERTEFPSPQLVVDRFGSMPEFHKACGFEIGPQWQHYSNEQLVEIAKEISPDRAMRYDDFKTMSRSIFPSVSFIYRRFGTLKKFQEACGFEQYSWSDWSDEDLAALAKDLSPNVPFSPRLANSIDRDEFPSSDYIYDRYGSFGKFNELCGYEIKEKVDWQKFTNSEVIKLAKYLSPDEPLTQTQIRKMDRTVFPSSKFIYDRFGSMPAFQKACGFEI